MLRGLYLLLLFGLLFTACAPGPSSSPAPSAPAESEATTPPEAFAPMLAAVNDARRSGYDCGPEGQFGAAPPLVWNADLALAAADHSRDMLAGHFFSHTGSDGTTVSRRVERWGYDWSLVGENLAYATPGHFSPVSVVEAWLGSPGHCANLMHSGFREFGAAKVSGDLEYWTQVFGTPEVVR